MIELNSVLVVILVEVVIAFVIMLIISVFSKTRKAENEHAAASKVVNKLDDTENFKTKKLEKMIVSHCEIESGELEKLLADISRSERTLYQKIIRLYLTKDEKTIKTIDKHIDNLTEPYCKLLSFSSTNSGNTEEIASEVEKLGKENQMLAKQLSASMKTMDEISAEYTRVFSGTQSEMELQNSSKKMMTIFSHAEHQIKQLVMEMKAGK